MRRHDRRSRNLVRCESRSRLKDVPNIRWTVGVRCFYRRWETCRVEEPRSPSRLFAVNPSEAESALRRSLTNPVSGSVRPKGAAMARVIFPLTSVAPRNGTASPPKPCRRLNPRNFVAFSRGSTRCPSTGHYRFVSEQNFSSTRAFTLRSR